MTRGIGSAGRSGSRDSSRVSRLRKARGRRSVCFPDTGLGFSIVEVVIGILLTAFVVVSIMAVCLTARAGITRSELKDIATNAAASLLGQLQRFNTASNSNGSYANDATSGPAAGGSWYLTEDTSCSKCYALTPGTHVVSSLLPQYHGQAVKDPPYNMSMSYTVTDYGNSSDSTSSSSDPSTNSATEPDNSRYQISVTVSWSEPPS